MPSVITPCGGGGGGIQFDTYPQAGQWLYVETDGADTSPSGFGMEFFDDSGNGINLAARGGGDVYLRTRGGGKVELDSTSGIFIHEENTGGTTGITIQSTFHDLSVLAKDKITIASGQNDVSVTSAATNKVVLNSLNSWVYVGEGGGFPGIFITQAATATFATSPRILIGGNVVVQVPGPTGGSDGRFQIRDDGGHPLFEVRGDGTIHGKASIGMITWDL